MIWKPVVGFEGFYLVSDTGEVKSVRKNRLLKPSIDRYGYLKLVLTLNGKPHYVTVHRLVAMAFIPNPEGKKTVNHINEDKLDNRVGNLEWMTSKENDNHGSRNQRMAQTKCKRPVMAISKEGVITEYEGVKDASRKLGIAHSQIATACRTPGKLLHDLEWRYVNVNH